MAYKPSDRAGVVFGELRKLGYPEHVAAALTGNIIQESGHKLRPDAVGDGGAAYGMVQWNGPRKRAYLRWAEANGFDPADTKAQVRYLDHELKTTERGARDAIMKAPTLEDATRIASNRFWRPGVPMMNNRLRYAAGVMNNYGGGVVRVADAKFDPNKYEAFKQDRATTAEKPAVSEPAGTTRTEGAKFDANKYEAFKAGRAGEPTVTTTAPKAPEGLDAPPTPNWWQRQAAGVEKAIFGDAEFPVPELRDSASTMLSPFFRPELAGNIQDQIRKNMGGDATDEKVKWAYNDLMSGLMVADDEEAMANIVKKYTGLDAIPDINGNLYVDVNGERYALDKSGLSPRDIDEAVIGLGRGAATVMTGAGIGGGLTRFIGVGAAPGRVLGAAAGGFVDQAGEQVLSNYYGGGKPFDQNRALMGALFAGGGEALGIALEKLAPKVWQAVTAGKKTARTLDEFERNLADLGFSPDDIRTLLRQGMNSPAAEGLDGAALARIADAANLPHPVSLTRGQSTRDLGVWGVEDKARNMGWGDEVGGEALALSREQQKRLHANAAHLFGEWNDAGNTGARAEKIQGVLASRRAANWATVNKAYEVAREAGDVALAPRLVLDMADEMRDKIRAASTPSMMKVTREMLDELDEIITASVDTTGRTVTPVSLQRLEQWRSKVTNLIPSADGGDLVGLRTLVRNYDEAASNTFGSAVVNGDASAIRKWRRAIKARADFGKKWESDDILATLTKRSGRGEGRGDLVVSPEDAMEKIIGKATFGGVKDAAKSVQDLKRILGADSEAFNQIKAAGLKNLLGFSPTTDVAMRKIEAVPTNLVRNWDKARSDKAEVIKALFTSEEQSYISRLARTIDTVNNEPTVAGMINKSRSGYVVLEGAGDQLQKAADLLNRMRTRSPGGALIASFFYDRIKTAADMARQDAVRRSLSGLPPPAAIGPALPGAGGVVGAETGEDVFGRPGFLR